MMEQEQIIGPISKLRRMYNFGELEIGTQVTLEGLTVKQVNKNLGMLVLNDDGKTPLKCFGKQGISVDLVEGSIVEVTGTYHPSSLPSSDDEFFKIYEIKSLN